MSNLKGSKPQCKPSPHPSSVLKPSCVSGHTVPVLPCPCLHMVEGKWAGEIGAVPSSPVWPTSRA